MSKTARIFLAIIAIVAFVSSLAANAQMSDLARARWKVDSVRAELESREKNLTATHSTLLQRRDEIDRAMTALTEARRQNEEEIIRVRHEINRIHLELLQ